MGPGDEARDRLIGAVLMGGAGSRMGGDKASVMIDGRSMAGHVVDALRAAGIGRMLAVGSEVPRDLADVELVPDRWPAAGPLAAMASAVAAASPESPRDGDPIVVVVACDQPGLSPTLVTSLVTALTNAGPEHLAAVPRTPDGRRHPFPSAWRASGADALADLVLSGARRADAGWDQAQAIDVPANPDDLADLDTPEDVAAWTTHRSKRSHP